jgi:acyl-CoA thioester hydrolase
MEFHWPIRVYYEDTDAGGVVYHANYISFMERARTEALRQLGFGQAALIASSGLAFAVRNIHVDYRKPARLDDELTVRSTVTDLGRAQLTFHQTVLRNDEILVQAKVHIACFSVEKARAAAIPKDIHEKLQAVTVTKE